MMELWRLQLTREDMPISKRLREWFYGEYRLRYMGELRYIINKNIGIRTHYDSNDNGLWCGDWH